MPNDTTTVPIDEDDLIDELAQEIRRVDGDHSRGAASLAEALMPFFVSTIARAAQPPAGWREALEFYASQRHFWLSCESAWDTVSGEPQNFWCDEAGTATVEDGTVAAMALRGTPLTDEEAVPTAQEAPTAVAGPVKLPFAIMDDELEALRRFDECARDFEAGGHDVRKEMMKRLAEIGLVRRVTANIYEHTTFGLSVLGGDFDAEPTAQAAPAAVAGQCEDAIELLGKYKELCEEIKRGDSYHLGRIDSAISVLAQTAPQPAVQQEPVAWMDDGTLRAGSEATAYRVVTDATKRGMTASLAASFITPLYAHPAAPAAQGDALDAERYRLLRRGQRWSVIDGIGDTLRGDELDAAIDAVRAAKEGSA